MKHEVFISRLLLAYLEEHLSHSVLTIALCNKIVALCQDRSSSLSIKKIVPKNASYYCCTVEAMPIEKRVEFIGIDEVQIAGDYERGYIFK